ncbi:hypothetical protein [Rhodopila sp.]
MRRRTLLASGGGLVASGRVRTAAERGDPAGCLGFASAADLMRAEQPADV